jgi:hypothetical protein
MLTPGFKARRCRSSFLNLLFVHNLFSDIDLEPLKLPYCYVSLPVKHLLKNPFLPYDSLDSSDGVRTFSRDWNCFAESMRRRKHIPYVSGNLLRSSRDHVGKEDSRLGWSECDCSYHGKRDRQMDYDCFISISKSAWLDSILKTGLLG